MNKLGSVCTIKMLWNFSHYVLRNFTGSKISDVINVCQSVLEPFGTILTYCWTEKSNVKLYCPKSRTGFGNDQMLSYVTVMIRCYVMLR